MNKFLSLILSTSVCLSAQANAAVTKTKILVDQGYVIVQYVKGVTQPELILEKAKLCDVLAEVIRKDHQIEVKHPSTCLSGNKITLKISNSTDYEVSLKAGTLEVNPTQDFLKQYGAIQAVVSSGTLVSEVSELKSIRSENYSGASAEYQSGKTKNGNKNEIKFKVDAGTILLNQ
jgi:hypothetical protein